MPRRSPRSSWPASRKATKGPRKLPMPRAVHSMAIPAPPPRAKTRSPKTASSTSTPPSVRPKQDFAIRSDRTRAWPATYRAPSRRSATPSRLIQPTESGAATALCSAWASIRFALPSGRPRRSSAEARNEAASQTNAASRPKSERTAPAALDPMARVALQREFSSVPASTRSSLGTRGGADEQDGQQPGEEHHGDRLALPGQLEQQRKEGDDVEPVAHLRDGVGGEQPAEAGVLAHHAQEACECGAMLHRGAQG